MGGFQSSANCNCFQDDAQMLMKTRGEVNATIVDNSINAAKLYSVENNYDEVVIQINQWQFCSIHGQTRNLEFYSINRLLSSDAISQN